jgi:PKHD-type hydroxylase
MKYWWQHFPKAFTQAECEWLIEYAKESTKPATATVGHGGKSIVNEDLRRSQVRWLNRSDAKLSALFQRIEMMALRANANAFGFDLSGFYEVQFTEYHADNDGTYGWHEDNAWTKNSPFDRKMSMVVQLSNPDSYTGGKLQLHNDPLPAGTFENQGDTIFFPSFNRHMVTPVKLGTRYSLVTWFVGPKFR